MVVSREISLEYGADRGKVLGGRGVQTELNIEENGRLLDKALQWRREFWERSRDRRIFLRQWNALASDLLEIGEKLHLGEPEKSALLCSDGFLFFGLNPLDSDGVEKRDWNRLKTQFSREVIEICQFLLEVPPFSGKISDDFDSPEFKQKGETYRRMLMSSADRVENILSLLAYKLYQLRNIAFFPIEEQFQIAVEAREIYAPFSNRLGIAWMKNEFEDLSLRYLFPKDYYLLVSKIALKKKEREQYIAEVQSEIASLLREHGIKGRVMGRPKHLNSIFLKMIKRKSPFEKLFDLIAFMVICQTKEQCYEVLSLVHSKWKPVPGRFKDYIARPKENNYQSLHTTVIGPYQKQMEVQIRTEEMHAIAEEGIAAHCLYKEGRSDRRSREEIAWLRGLFRKRSENIPKAKPFSEKIFVRTPRGEIKELRKGATPLDFAYAVHTEVGHRCSGAKVNGKIVPLRYELQDGDVVEIITSPNARPNQNWLDYVKTTRARSKIRAYLRAQQREKAIEEGQLRLERALPKANRNLNRLRKSGKLDLAVQHFSCRSVEELFAQIGFGRIKEQTVVRYLFPQTDPGQPGQTFRREQRKVAARELESSNNSVIVSGYKNVMTRFARCCNPLPGDPIVGFISRGRGIIIHVEECPRLDMLDPERLIDVKWKENNPEKFVVTLRIEAKSQGELVPSISRVFSANSTQISDSRWIEEGKGKKIGLFECQVQSISQLNKLIDELEKVDGVSKVRRVRGKIRIPSSEV